MRQAGQPHSRWHHLGHTATAVAAVVGVITGAFVGVAGSVVTVLTTPVLAAVAVAVAVAAFAGLLADQERRWRRSDASLQPHFLPDWTPAMPVTAFGERPDRAAFPALVGADSGRLGHGPRAVQAGGRLKYRLSELDRWLDAHEESFTEEQVEAAQAIEEKSNPSSRQVVRTRTRATSTRSEMWPGRD